MYYARWDVREGVVAVERQLRGGLREHDTDSPFDMCVERFVPVPVMRRRTLPVFRMRWSAWRTRDLEALEYRMVHDMERTGASYSASSLRETIAYCAEGLREQTSDMVGIVAESAFIPAVTVEDAESLEWNIAMKAHFEEFKDDCVGCVAEAIHAAAFRGNTLGKCLLI